jgi:peptidoglycan/xylan/chitin deacetylase (PgdA/CDA1 family)
VPRRRLLASFGLLACFALGVALVTGGDERARARHIVHVPPSPKPPPPKRSPTGIDKALRYTDFVARGSPRRREVALTFDDGPSPWTPKLVKALRRLHAHATFFPIGYAIVRYPRYLKLLARRGFTIGDHTMNHPNLAALSGPRQLPEIDGQASLLRGAKIPYPRLFRPPYGSFDKNTLGLLQERRMLMVLWSVNPEDYYRPGSKVIVARVLQAARPGAIVLMHDGGGDRSQTVAAVPRIVRQLRRRGYRIVSVPRLLADDPPPRHQGQPPGF